MMSLQSHDHNVLFTGGVPAATVDEVFRTLSSAVGSRALAYPDGEIGERQNWILALNSSTWPHVIGVDEVESPLPKDDPMRAFKAFRIADNVTELNLDGLLPYAKGALESYSVFKQLRDEGVIGADVRFQMPIPMAHDAVCFYFPNVDDWPLAMAAWSRALQAEFRAMLEFIPADDLVIQLDYCTELCQITGAAHERQADWIPGGSPDISFDQYTAGNYLVAHAGSLPEDVLLGYHICAGTYPMQPVSELSDIGIAIDLANALAKNSGRRVDYFHLPVMRHAAEHYFQPLTRLDVGTAAVYLGLECNDGRVAMKQRIDCARKYLDDFGVAHYCGYALNADILPQLLGDLAAGSDYAAGAR